MTAKPFDARNQTPGAKRKIKGLAKAGGLPVDFVGAIAGFAWDYDEEVGWVTEDGSSPAAQQALRLIAAHLGLPLDFQLRHDTALRELKDARHRMEPAERWALLAAAGPAKDYGRLAEFAAYYYLRGVNEETEIYLKGTGATIGLPEIASDLFMKHFRGGDIDMRGLTCIWCYLVLDAKCDRPPTAPSYAWLDQLLSAIEALPPASSITELVGCCKGILPGDKRFHEAVLLALAYADVLRVTDIPVTEIFLACHSDRSCQHNYSNYFGFPLRFWMENGGSVNRAAVVVPLTP